jgi:hypothetical protein
VLAAAKEDLRSIIAATKPAPIEPPAPPTPEPEPTPSGSLLYDQHFTGSPIAGGVEAAATSRVSFSGGIGRFETRPGDEWPKGSGSSRTEYVVGNAANTAEMLFAEGTDLHVRQRIRVPSQGLAPWLILTQLHEASSNNSPGVALFYTEDGKLRLGKGDSSAFWFTGVVDLSKWTDVVFRALLSQDPSKGVVQVWVDGTEVLPPTKAATATLAQTFCKFGNYRSHEAKGITVSERELFRIGTSLAAVTG